MKRKPRIDGDGPSALQRLKSLPAQDHEALLARSEEVSAKSLTGYIEQHHGIPGLSEQDFSRFLRWHAEQQALAEMNQAAMDFRENFSAENPAASLEEAHEATLAWLHLRGARLDDEKLMKFVLGEIRKARSLSHEQAKWKEELKGKLETGLDALFLELKGNEKAAALFEQLKATLGQ